MSNVLGVIIAVALVIAAIALWFKETEVRGWHQEYTEHRFRFVSVIFVVAAAMIIYKIFFEKKQLKYPIMFY